MPGTTKPSDAGFMVSTISAKMSVSISRPCARVSRSPASLFGTDTLSALGGAANDLEAGMSPNATAPVPATINAMPTSIVASIGIPAIM